MFASKEREESLPHPCGCIVATSVLESSYVSIVRAGPTSESPDIPALLVAIEYLCVAEGPLWQQIRGKGLAYGFAVNHSSQIGIVSFSLSESTKPLAALLEAKKVLQRVCGIVPDDDTVDEDGDEEEDD